MVSWVSDVALMMLIIIPLFLFFIIRSVFKTNYIIIYIFSLLIYWYCFISSNPYNTNINNKYEILKHIPKEYLPDTFLISDTGIDKLQYPIIFKPTICTRKGVGVELIHNIEEARNYVYKYGWKNIISQKYINSKYEIGILYERNPLSKCGKIISIIERANYDDIVRNKSSYSVNNSILEKYKSRPEWITPTICNIIDSISKKIPNFYVGRYDIKFNSVDEFLKGKFYILEVNGNMGFDLERHCYHKNLVINQVFSIINTIRWICVRLFYGLINILNFKSYNIKELPCILYQLVYNTIKCGDWEKFFTIYS